MRPGSAGGHAERDSGMPGNLPDGTYYVTMAWINATGEEGASAIPAADYNGGQHTAGAAGDGAANAHGLERLCGRRPGSDDAAKRVADRQSAQTWLQPNAVTTGGQRARLRAIAQLPRPVPRIDPEGLMTSTIGSAITAKVIQLITGAAGVNSALAASDTQAGSSAGPLNAAQVRAQNVAPDIADRSARCSTRR